MRLLRKKERKKKEKRKEKEKEMTYNCAELAIATPEAISFADGSLASRFPRRRLSLYTLTPTPPSLNNQNQLAETTNADHIRNTSPHRPDMSHPFTSPHRHTSLSHDPPMPTVNSLGMSGDPKDPPSIVPLIRPRTPVSTARLACPPREMTQSLSGRPLSGRPR